MAADVSDIEIKRDSNDYKSDSPKKREYTAKSFEHANTGIEQQSVYQEDDDRNSAALE